jgi:hypothetical protein
MGQYQADFSAESLGVKTDIAGWTRRWDYQTGANATMEIVADAEGQGGKALRFTQSQNVRSLLSLDALDADANNDQIEIAGLFRYTMAPGENGPGFAVRGSGTPTTENGQVVQITHDSASAYRTRIYRYSGGAAIGSSTYGPNPSPQTGLYWVKAAASGSTFKVDVYDASDLSLFVSYQLTDATIAGVGWAGLFTFVAGAAYDVLDVLAATNGDTVTLYTTGGGGDVTAPVLSAPTGAATGTTTANVGATTDEANGTLYAIA